MAKALHLSPMIPSFDLGITGAFFTKVLGFKEGMNTEQYAIYYRDGCTVHVLRAGENIGQMECYLEVDNVDELWEQVKEKLAGIRVRPPFDRDYGMREMHLAIPQTNALLFIGHTL